MAIKLIKACKELNIGMATAVEFLNKQGKDLSVDPNVRIDDDLYLVLAKEFNKDMALKLEAEKRHQERQEREVPKTVTVEPKEEPKEVKIDAAPIQKPKVVGHIDLEPKKAEEPKVEETKAQEIKVEEPKAPAEAPKAKETPKDEKQPEKKAEPKPEPKVEPKAALKVEPKKVAETKEQGQRTQNEGQKSPYAGSGKKDNSGTAEAHKPQPTAKPAPVQAKTSLDNIRENKPVGLKVVDKIDLDKLNQSTKPTPKTKEEKRKEREERNKQRQGGGQQKPQGQDASKGQNNNEKRKRERIKQGKVDVNNPEFKKGGKGQNKNAKRPVKVEVDDEAVQKQIKETIARLQNQGKNKTGAKYRKEKRQQNRLQQEAAMEQAQAQSTVLKLTEFVTANELATMMNISVNQVIATCMSLGLMVSINQRLDAETINIVAEEFGFTTEYVSAEVAENLGADEEVNEADLEPRCPIITVMGHVDHGKTSLLDHIRNTNVIAGEAGGITQHIGAYNVQLKNGQHITFLDTPGHAAFTAMRARGAKVTDLAIIVVAADDAVMPQTVEAINHASAAGIPIIFAINKCDKPDANPEKIKEELANMNYLVEDWGGQYQSQDISAKKGIGVFELLEKVLLEAELLDLKANPKRRAKGSIIESSLDKGRGYVATVLVQDGTLRMGDVVLAGTYFGRVKAMFNERNQKITEARPGEPVLILGLNGAPQAGDDINVMNSDQEAREVANKREQLAREQSLRTKKHVGLEELGRRLALGDFKELNIIVKGDVDGSVEALSDSLLKLSTENIQVNIIHGAVGAISDSDILLAEASDAIVVGFNVRPTATARKMAEKEEIDIRLYSIIYDAIEEIKAAMQGMLSPDIKEEITATLEVLQTFRITKVGTIAGCIVREGKIKRNNKVRIIRDGIVIHTGDLASLKHEKDDVKEIGTNQQCGLNIRSYNDLVEGDIIESFETIEVAKTL